MNKKIAALLAAAAFLCASQAWAAERKSADYVEMYSGELTTLNYLISASNNEHIMFANMIDSLVEYDRYGVLKPSLALSWSTSPDGLVWTFKLRQGVKWLTYQGSEYAELVAQDWVDAAKYIMTKANASQTADIIYGVVKNGADYFNGKISDFGLVGVKAKDKYTLEYTLARPVPYFLSMLTYVSFLPLNGKFLAEAGARFGTDNKGILYNGAYVMRSFEPMSSRELVRNEKYWDRANISIPRLIYKYNKEMVTLSPELFTRGEVSFATIPSAVIESWMKDPAKAAMVKPARLTSYSYFYAFNFNPKFGPEYEPENWKAAVNDKNFRKAIFHALDRKAAMLTSEPYTPERRLQSTITPRNFAGAGGKDYVDIGELAAYAKADSFNKARALEFKAAALKSLAGKASFPVKILMPYNAGLADWANRGQIVEQQLENLLGKDFIDVIPAAFPSTGFLNATRRAGNFAIQECNWGPDYADPETYSDPFVASGTYNKPDMALGYADAGGKPKYDAMIEAAKAQVTDMKKRMELFSKAEAFLIGEAFVIPYARGGGGYDASKINPCEAPFAPFGMSILKFKGQAVRDKAYGTEEFASIEAKWQSERDAALAAEKD